MIGERIFDRDALVQRFGLSLRLGGRIVALLGRKIDVSASLLDAAAHEKEMAAVLLDRKLLPAEGEPPDEQGLQSLARAKKVDYADLLRVLPGEEGWHTIALEDDVLAEQAGGEGLASLALAAVEAGSITPAETETLFTPEEIARLKLIVMTSQDPEERMEAVRKLVFVPLPAGQKASLLVGVLVDPTAEPRVRQEALRSLEQIGFSAELADALQRLFGGGEEDVLYAAQRLQALLGEADDAEKGVTLAVLLEVFREAQTPRVIAQLLELITGMAGTLVSSPQKTAQFAQSALRQLARCFDPLRIPVERALLDCERRCEGIVAPLLLKEVDRHPDARVRSFLISLVAGVTKDRKTLRSLAEAALKELLDARLPERQRSYLRYGLVRLGESAARVVLDVLAKEASAPRPELIRLLDVLCTEGEVSDKTVNESAGFLLTTLQVADRETRRLVTEAALCSNERVAKELRVKVARELLANMTEFRARDTAESICNRLESIGPPALGPLLDFLVRRYPRAETEFVFVSLGRLVKAHGKDVPKKLAKDILDFCTALFDDPDAPIGAFAVTTACLCGYTAEGARHLDQALKTMQERLWKVAYTYEIFDALAELAGSANAKAKHQKELFELFDRMANMKGPERLGVQRQTAQGMVYEFGVEVYFDTRVVPAVVRGMESIVVSEAAPTALRKEIVKRLLILWEGVSHARVVWSPGAVGALIRAMCSAGSSEHVTMEMRVRLGHSLVRFLKRVAVVRAIGEICSRTVSGPEAQALCVKAGEAMLVEWETSDQQDDERRLALLVSMSRLAGNPTLSADKPSVQHMRENVLQALFLALRSGVNAVREPLEMLRDSEALTEGQRAEIRSRLSHTFGLVKQEEA